MYSWFTLNPLYSNRLEPLRQTASVRGDGVAELFAAINGTHETTGRPVDVGINSGRQRTTRHASISTVLGTSTETLDTGL